MSDRDIPEYLGIRLHNRTLYADLWYPRVTGSGGLQAVELGLTDVRVADSIRIEYDYERDGYVIKQASTFEWDPDDTVCDPDWQEVAFVKAWAREKASRNAASPVDVRNPPPGDPHR